MRCAMKSDQQFAAVFVKNLAKFAVKQTYRYAKSVGKLVRSCTSFVSDVYNKHSTFDDCADTKHFIKTD